MIRRIIKLLFLLFFYSQTLIAQYSEYEVKAAYLKSIAQFVEWPIGDSITEDSPFVISVIGSNPFNSYLDELAKESNIYSRPIFINYVNSPQIPQSDIVFISESEKNSVEEILEILKGKETLIVSDSEGFAEQGVHINFYPSKKNILFEINLNSVKTTNLKISSRLLKLSRIIQ